MSKNTCSVAIKQCSTSSINPSLVEEGSSLLWINTTYSQPANLVPHFWNYKIVDKEGSPDLPCIMILSELMGWFRSLSKSSTYYSTGKSLPELVNGQLAISYDFLSEKLNFQKERIRRNLVKLEKLEILKRDVRNIALEDGSRISQLYISIDNKFFASCFRDPELDIAVRTPEFASLEGGVFKEDHHLSGEHIRIKNKNRSMKSNFLENSFEEKEEGRGERSSLENEIVSTNTDDDNSLQQKTSFTDKIKTALQNKIYKDKPKQLKDFYPLTKEDCSLLQSSSGRDFSLNAMNEILLDMSKRLVDPSFFSKKGFLGYMSKAFQYEKRDAVVISNATFKIRANLDQSELDACVQEKYLTELEYSLQVSPEWHFKKKLAAVLERSKAYKVLTAFKEVRIDAEGRAALLLNKQVCLSENDKQIILQQIKATHEGIEGRGAYDEISTLAIKMPEYNTTRPKNEVSERTGVWGKIRNVFVGYYQGEHGEGIDKNWLAKIEAKIDDNQKTINLKAPSEFFKNYIESNLLSQLTSAIKQNGFELNSLEC